MGQIAKRKTKPTRSLVVRQDGVLLAEVDRWLRPGAIRSLDDLTDMAAAMAALVQRNLIDRKQAAEVRRWGEIILTAQAAKMPSESPSRISFVAQVLNQEVPAPPKIRPSLVLDVASEQPRGPRRVEGRVLEKKA